MYNICSYVFRVFQFRIIFLDYKFVTTSDPKKCKFLFSQLHQYHGYHVFLFSIYTKYTCFGQYSIILLWVMILKHINLLTLIMSLIFRIFNLWLNIDSKVLIVNTVRGFMWFYLVFALNKHVSDNILSFYYDLWS